MDADQTPDENTDEVFDITTATEAQLRDREAALREQIETLRSEPRTLENVTAITELRSERNVVVDAVNAIIELGALDGADATLADLTAADGYLFGTPETFGSMCGLLKDFFERTYYPAQEQLRGRPYALFVCAGNDGSGAVREIGRIANGYRWKSVAEALIVRNPIKDENLLAAEELGEAMAAGLAMGIF